jgi:hypothetical protein
LPNEFTPFILTVIGIDRYIFNNQNLFGGRDLTDRPTTITTATDDRTDIRRHLWILLAVAVSLRILYFILAASHLDLEQVGAYSLDSQAYLTVARHFLDGDPMGDYYLFRVGPGYGLIIAGIQSLFGTNLTYVTGFSLLMGCLAPVVVYLLAYNLTHHKTMAFLSGLISAISLTSIALSSNILTDQPFFTIHAASMVCFVLGLLTGKWRWFLYSGLLAAVALFVKSTTMFWPFLLLLISLVVPVSKKFSSRPAMLGRVALTAGIMIVLIAAWSYHNYVKYDVFAFGSNGVLTIRSNLGVKAIVDNTEEDDITELRSRWIEEDLDFGDDLAELYNRARDRFVGILTAHPGWVIKAYFDIAWSNIRTGNYLSFDQIPALLPFWRLTTRVNETFLGALIFFASIAGVIYLFIDRNYIAAVFLGITYAYFTFLSGFSFWQGSRIYYPAEMAWSILVVYAGYRIWPQLARLINRLHNKKQVT